MTPLEQLQLLTKDMVFFKADTCDGKIKCALADSVSMFFCDHDDSGESRYLISVEFDGGIFRGGYELHIFTGEEYTRYLEREDCWEMTSHPDAEKMYVLVKDDSVLILDSLELDPRRD